MLRFKSNNIGIIITLSVICLAMWVLNYLTPKYTDDYWYPYMFIGDSFDINRPIESFKEILISQYNHYFGYNGRNIIHTIVQLFAGILGKPIFNVFNAIAFAVFVYLLTRMTSKVSVINIIFTCAVIFFLFPEFNRTVLWMSGSVNYLWTSIVICLFIMLFECLRMEDLQVEHYLWLIPSLIAGWTHEGITFPLTISLIIYAVINRKTVCGKAVSPLIVGFVIGALICAFSPATVVRAGVMDGDIFRLLLIKILNGLKVCIKLKAVWVLLGTLLILYFAKKHAFWVWLKNFYNDNAIMWNTMLLSFCIVLFSGVVGSRIGIGVELFAIILWLRTIFVLNTRIAKAIKIVCILWGGVLYVPVLYYSIHNYREYEKINLELEDRTTEVIAVNENWYPSCLGEYILNPVAGLNGSLVGHIYDLVLDLYGCNKKIFMPVNVYNDILAEDEKISDIHKQNEYPCYVIPLPEDMEGKDIKPIYVLNPTDYKSLPFYIRPFASRLARYTETKIPAAEHLYETVNIGDKNYLILFRHDLVDYRLKEITLK